MLLKDVFEGSLYITDVPGLEENMTIRLTRQNGVWAGQIISTGVWDVEATKDFEHVTIAFASTYERTGSQVQASFDRGSATFLSLGAPNRAYALRQLQELILKQN